MNRRTWTILLLGVAAMMLLAQYALTQGCTPGYSNGSITAGDLLSQCVEVYPASQTRTDVGIGEDVTLWIDGWQGTCTYTDQYCHQTPVTDGPGTVTWSVSGQGSVYPTVTDGVLYTTLTIDLADEDNVVTVSVTAQDQFLAAPPVQRQKTLNAKIPNGIQVLSATDNPGTNGWQQGNANLGASDAFLFQVLPNTVNFNKVSFQIALSGVNNLKWPDGNPLNMPATTFAITTQSIGQSTNLWSQSLKVGLNPVGRIAGQNLDMTNAGNAQYQDQAGVWKGFCSFSVSAKYNGATDQEQIGVISSNTLYGGWQGPWQ